MLFPQFYLKFEKIVTDLHGGLTSTPYSSLFYMMSHYPT